MFVSVLERQRAILKTGIITQLFVQLGSILGAMTKSRFVAITPWPGGE